MGFVHPTPIISPILTNTRTHFFLVKKEVVLNSTSFPSLSVPNIKSNTGFETPNQNFSFL